MFALVRSVKDSIDQTHREDVSLVLLSGVLAQLLTLPSCSSIQLLPLNSKNQINTAQFLNKTSQPCASGMSATSFFSPTLSNLDVFGTPFRCPMHPDHGDRNRWHFRCISCYSFPFFNFFESKSELLRQTSRKLSGNLNRLDVIADHFERLVYSSYICLYCFSKLQCA